MTVTPEPPDGPEGPDGPDRRDPTGPADASSGHQRSDGPPDADAERGPQDHESSGSGPLSDSDIDTMFAGIVAGLEPQMRWGLRRGQENRPASGPTDAVRPTSPTEPPPAAAGDSGSGDQPAPGAFQRRASDRPTADGPPGGAAGPTGADERDRRADREALEREIAHRERERRTAARRDAADDRAERRELRRIERAAELAAFEAHQAEIQAARDADQEHYDPPEPPPVPRPRGRALGALVCLAAGLLLLIRPSLVGVAPDAALVLSVLLLFSGAGLLVWGLRSRRDSDDDDGAVV